MTLGSNAGGLSNIAQGYNETLSERRSRLFWESQTFETTGRILDAVIFQNPSPDPLLLLRARAEPRHGSSELFAMLFEPTRQDIRVVMMAANEQVGPSLRQKTKKKSFRLDIAYRGSDFCGWQTQPNNRLRPSVQQSLEEWLQPLCPDAPVDVRASGRTDAGVHSLGQVCRFRTHADMSAAQVLAHLQACPLTQQGSLRCLKVTQVSESFHPTFGCKKRAYAYIMDSKDMTENQVEYLNAMLQVLEGLELDYFGFSYGKTKTETTLCTLQVARAFSATHSSEKVICIELISDRFLRRMVRILVATALRQVMDISCHNNNNGLLDIIQRQDRKASAKAAPPAGLIFVGAAFED
jgi:tRNA pseudouridine(38-40) synthase